MLEITIQNPSCELFYSNFPRTLLVSEGSMYRILEVDMKSGEIVGVFSEGGTLGAVDNIRRAADGGKVL